MTVSRGSKTALKHRCHLFLPNGNKSGGDMTGNNEQGSVKVSKGLDLLSGNIEGHRHLTTFLIRKLSRLECHRASVQDLRRVRTQISEKLIPRAAHCLGQ